MPRTAREIPALTQEQVARFWSRVEKQPGCGCWMWLGATHNGYGVVSFFARWYAAHRVALALSGVPLVPGLVSDHICRNRACVRPDHIEQITNRDNLLRGIGPAATNARKVTCPRGHALTPAKYGRECRVCIREQKRLRRARDGRRDQPMLKRLCPLCLVQLTASARCRPCAMRAAWQRPDYAERLRAERAGRRRRCLHCREPGLTRHAKHHAECWKAVLGARSLRLRGVA